MDKLPQPPATFQEFVRRYPEIGRAWDVLGDAGKKGPLDAKTQRLVKLAISFGALREGAAHSAVRKALATGVTREEIEQVIALAASTIGLPSAVAVYSWVRDCIADRDKG